MAESDSTRPDSEREVTWKYAKEILAEGDRHFSERVKDAPIKYCYRCGTELQTRITPTRWFDETTGQRRTTTDKVCPKCDVPKPFWRRLRYALKAFVVSLIELAGSAMVLQNNNFLVGTGGWGVIAAGLLLFWFWTRNEAWLSETLIEHGETGRTNV